jgi:uncharacterized membrane protein
MSTSADRLVEDYLDRLELEPANFPSARRRELVQEISEHIAEARAQLDSESEADVRNLLDRMGDPADIAAEARGGPEEPPAVAVPLEERRTGAVEIGALVLLLIGGLVLPVIGWVVGVVLLWVSSAWTVPQKLLGTLVVPGGLALPLGLGLLATSSATCVQVPVAGAPNPIACTSGGSGSQAIGTVVVILLAVASVATVAYLARRMNRNAEVATA